MPAVDFTREGRTTLPGSTIWVTWDRETKTLLVGDGDATPVTAKFDGKGPKDDVLAKLGLEGGVLGMLGLDAEHVALTDGESVVRLARRGTTFTREATWAIPDDLRTPIAVSLADGAIWSLDYKTLGPLVRFEWALEKGADVSEYVRALTATNDDSPVLSMFKVAYRNSAVFPMLPELLRSPHPRVRFHTADYYGARPELFAGRGEELVPLLADPDPKVVSAATFSIGKIGGVDISTVTPLLAHGDESVRQTATVALLELKDPTGIAAIVDALREGDPALAVIVFLRLDPKKWKKLMASAPDEICMQLQSPGMTLEAYAKATGITLGDDIAPELREQTMVLERGSFVEVLEKLHCSIIVEDDRFQITSPARGAAWWAAEIERHNAAS